MLLCVVLETRYFDPRENVRKTSSSSFSFFREAEISRAKREFSFSDGAQGRKEGLELENKWYT